MSPKDLTFGTMLELKRTVQGRPERVVVCKPADRSSTCVVYSERRGVLGLDYETLRRRYVLV